MIYLLDTDMLIFMVRSLKASGGTEAGRRRALALVRRCRRAQKSGDSVGLSAVTVSELEFGAQKNGRYDVEIEAVGKILLPFDTYDYDAVSCPYHYGIVRSQLETKGRTIGAMDLLIAAHALRLQATLVTNNQTHFSRVEGLRTANWLRGGGGTPAKRKR